MNAEIDRLQRATERDVQTLGSWEAFQKHALGSLKLRTVAKESHGSEIRALAFNHVTKGCGNLLASLARDQVTVYDDAFLQDHLHVSIQYCIEADKYPDAELKALGWVSGSSWTRHPFGDAVLAVGGTTGVITLISVVAAQVIAQLPVGAGTVVSELASAAGAPGLLCCLLGQGQNQVQLWDARSSSCLRTWAADAFTMALHPSGTLLMSADRSGAVSTWHLLQLPNGTPGAPGGTTSSMPAAAQQPGAGHSTAAAAQQQGASPSSSTAAAAVKQQEGGPSSSTGTADDREVVEVEDWQQHLGSLECSSLQVAGLGGSPVDGLAVLPGDRLLVKGADGRMLVVPLPSSQPISSWRVPGFSSSSSSYSHDKRCVLGHSADGRLVCIGNPHGSTYVYDASSGQQLAVQAAFRVEGPARATAVSGDGRHLLAAIGHGYLFRFEYNSLKAAQEREQEQQLQEAQQREQQQQLHRGQQQQPDDVDVEVGQLQLPGSSAQQQQQDEEEEEREMAEIAEPDTLAAPTPTPPPTTAVAAEVPQASAITPSPGGATPLPAAAAAAAAVLQPQDGPAPMDWQPAAAAAAAGRQPLSVLEVPGQVPLPPPAAAAGATPPGATPAAAAAAAVPVASEGKDLSSAKRQRVGDAAGAATAAGAMPQVSPLVFRRTP